MELRFFGAAGEVTGSCTQVRYDGGIFLVDCGMFQGGQDAGRKNVGALNFDLRGIDFVLLTHAHLDHSGLVPRLVSLGYRGPVYATAATVDLLEVMLLDAAHIQEKEAEWASKNNRKKNLRRGFEAAPLYTVAQALDCLSSLRKVEYGENFEPRGDVRCRFHDAGHILGSAIIEIDLKSAGREHKFIFSGDLGQPIRPVLRDPTLITKADFLCIESTYGNRAHRPIEETENELVEVLRNTLECRRGNVIIPAFAVGRTQEVIFILADLVRSGKIPQLEVVVDSPMASAVTELTLNYKELWDEETRELLKWVSEHPKQINVRFVQDVQDSIALNEQKSGLVIISASGMCEAGRIRHHLKYNIGRSECSIVICGFQAAGTLGRRLVDGVSTVKLFGERIPVRASIHTIGGLSAHADQPALLGWLRHFKTAPRKTFIVHGEPDAASAFADAITEQLKWPGITIAEADQIYELK